MHGQQLPGLGDDVLGPLRRGESISISMDGHTVDLSPGDVLVGTEQAADWVCANDRGLQVALAIALTPELEREGMARDIVRHIQQLRKDKDLEIQDRIRVFVATDNDDVRQTITEWGEYISSETLADSVELAREAPTDRDPVLVGDVKVHISID